MGTLRSLWRASHGSAATEMALVFPFMLVIMFGSVELGSLFLDQHSLTKQVRDGARYASRLPLSETFVCSSDIFQGDDNTAKAAIIKVTKDGAVDGAGQPHWTTYWTRNCTGKATTLTVTYRCVDKDDIDKDADGTTGIYTSLPGNLIPVVTVTGEVKYRSVLASLGIDATNICLTAESDVVLAGA
ncbi:MAG TPA: TadE/TadG family type IV pilus assembly protein [Sphingomicrobium sp.]|nr:TadE/TadG family type IV pilus assembly protein [Sphingomicrobium sp.]